MREYQALRNEVGSGITEEGKQKLHDLLNKYRDVLRHSLGNEPSAKVEPMCLDLQENTRPVAVKAGRYMASGRTFIERCV